MDDGATSPVALISRGGGEQSKTEPEMRRQRGSRTIPKTFAVTNRVFGESHRMRAGCLFFKDVRACF